jgi:thiamine-monophosphate kinase
MIHEFQIIERYFKPLAEGFAGALGLGDDAAVLQIPPDAETVVTTDAMVEGTHFLLTDTPESVAWRLLRSNVSDLAAMGATPLAYTLVTSFPETITEEWISRFAAALHQDQKLFSCHLMGGDTVRTKGPLHLSITMLGLVQRGQAMKRKIKRPITPPENFDIYVSGTIGDSALGLKLTLGEKIFGLDAEDEAFLIERHYKPSPRPELGRGIRTFALAAIDVSDGLVADVGHIAKASGVQAVIESAKVPLSPAAKKAVTGTPGLLETILTGGEDYELVFINDPRETGMLNIAAAKLNVPLTKIGHLQLANPGAVQVLDAENRPLILKQKGWQHF